MKVECVRFQAMAKNISRGECALKNSALLLSSLRAEELADLDAMGPRKLAIGRYDSNFAVTSQLQAPCRTIRLCILRLARLFYDSMSNPVNVL